MVKRTFVDGVLSMLADSGLPNSLWAEAMQTFTHCKNLAPHSALNGSIPKALYLGSAPSVSHLEAIGCQA